MGEIRTPYHGCTGTPDQKATESSPIQGEVQVHPLISRVTLPLYGTLTSLPLQWPWLPVCQELSRITFLDSWSATTLHDSHTAYSLATMIDVENRIGDQIVTRVALPTLLGASDRGLFVHPGQSHGHELSLPRWPCTSQRYLTQRHAENLGQLHHWEMLYRSTRLAIKVAQYQA